MRPQRRDTAVTGGGPGGVGGGNLAPSAGDLLQLIRRASLTRAQLQQHTGMSRTTLTERMEQLIGAGLVRETGRAARTGGRPAKILQFDDVGRVVLVFDLGHTHARVCAVSLRGEPLAHRDVAIDVTAPPDRVLGLLAAVGEQVVGELREVQVVGVGFGVPAPVDVVGATDWRTSPMSDWTDAHIHAAVGARWPVPVVLENDARALAIGEASLDESDQAGANIVMAVKMASGIGAGIVVDGHPLRGSTGAAGDVGHIRLASAGPRCRCGRRGCLAAYASGRAILRRLRHRRLDGLRGVVDLLDAHDREAVEVVTEAASAVGIAVGGALQGLNPRVLVLGGVLGSHPVVARVITAKVRMVALPRVLERTQIRTSALGESAGSVGLAHLLTRHLYSADAVDRMLGPGGPILAGDERPGAPMQSSARGA